MKVQKVFVACDRCKKKKRKCDGRHPCRRCLSASIQCVYDEDRLAQCQERNLDPAVLRTVLDLKYQNEKLSSEILETKQQLQLKEREFTKLRTLYNEQEQLLNSIHKQQPKPLMLLPVAQGSSREQHMSARTILATAVTKMLYHSKSSGSEYVGSFAIVSISKSIRNLLGAHEETCNTPQFLDIEGQYLGAAPKDVELSFLENFMTISHDRYFILEKGKLKDTFKLPASERTHWQHFYLNMALGIGCRLVPVHRVSTYQAPEYYFRNAMKHLASSELNPLRGIQTCALIAIFVGKCHKSYSYLSSWELAGMAMRKLVQYGYHRKRNVTLKHAMKYEFMKRLFWSIYNYEKVLSLSLGRPSSINEEFIDVPLPVSMEISDHPNGNEIRILYKAQKMQQEGVKFDQPITQVTSFIKTCTIRQIESRTNLLFYSVNSLVPSADSFDLIMKSIENWHQKLPLRLEFERKMKGYESYDYLELLYHRAKLLVLLPKIMVCDSKERASLLHLACTSAYGICNSYMGMYHDSVLVFSMFALHTAFLAGITMVYYVRLYGYPKFLKLGSSMKSCSTLLEIFAERGPECKVYQNIFNTLWNFVESNIQNKNQVETTSENVQGKEWGRMSSVGRDKGFDDSLLSDWGFNEDFWEQVMLDINK